MPAVSRQHQSQANMQNKQNTDFFLIFLQNDRMCRITVSQMPDDMPDAEFVIGPRVPFSSRAAAQRKRERAYKLALDEGVTGGWFEMSKQAFSSLIALTVEDCQTVTELN
jgi:hypothetical protein